MPEALTGGWEVPFIRDVRSCADRRAYLALVREPYAVNPNWVHPDIRILRNLLRRTALIAARSEWRALIAEEEGKPVACLTAFVHKSFEEKLGRKIGTIGFFEALRGHTRAVDALFREAEGWLRSRGATRVCGPINGQMMHGFGCLENRDTERPLFGTAHNPADYPGHWWRQHTDTAHASTPTRSTSAATTCATRSSERSPTRGGLARFTIDPELFWIAEIAGRLSVSFSVCPT
jgi:hypothetical protein